MEGGGTVDAVHYGKNIWNLRRKHGLTQEELARATGVSKKHIINVEQYFGNISVDLLIKICNVLKVTPNDILAGTYGDGENEDDSSEITSLLDGLYPDDRKIMQHFIYFLSKRK